MEDIIRLQDILSIATFTGVYFYLVGYYRNIITSSTNEEVSIMGTGQQLLSLQDKFPCADPGGYVGGTWVPGGYVLPRPSKVGPVTPQPLCSIGRYSGCAPLDYPLVPAVPPSLDHPFWIRPCCP